mmetsp:Transcript_28998/g.67474  ORF Transcript_28998/g.67474 Transcript_28998/m.67474 type:complete len:193 (-) Transcript_28998:74-652(-)
MSVPPLKKWLDTVLPGCLLELCSPRSWRDVELSNSEDDDSSVGSLPGSLRDLGRISPVEAEQAAGTIHELGFTEHDSSKLDGAHGHNILAHECTDSSGTLRMATGSSRMSSDNRPARAPPVSHNTEHMQLEVHIATATDGVHPPGKCKKAEVQEVHRAVAENGIFRDVSRMSTGQQAACYAPAAVRLCQVKT